MDIQQGEKLYQKVLEESRLDPNIQGLILCAGRGKGVVTERSDYDVLMIVHDQKLEEYKNKYESLYITEVFDVGVVSLTEFRNHAKMGGDGEWDRYNFAYLKAQVDKGWIQELIDEKVKCQKKIWMA